MNSITIFCLVAMIASISTQHLSKKDSMKISSQLHTNKVSKLQITIHDCISDPPIKTEKMKTTIDNATNSTILHVNLCDMNPNLDMTYPYTFKYDKKG